jgi:hypothetical protein
LQEDCGFVVEMVSGCKYMLLIVYDMLQNQLIVGSEYYAATTGASGLVAVVAAANVGLAVQENYVCMVYQTRKGVACFMHCSNIAVVVAQGSHMQHDHY